MLQTVKTVGAFELCNCPDCLPPRYHVCHSDFNRLFGAEVHSSAAGAGPESSGSPQEQQQQHPSTSSRGRGDPWPQQWGRKTPPWLLIHLHLPCCLLPPQAPSPPSAVLPSVHSQQQHPSSSSSPAWHLQQQQPMRNLNHIDHTVRLGPRSWDHGMGQDGLFRSRSESSLSALAQTSDGYSVFDGLAMSVMPLFSSFTRGLGVALLHSALNSFSRGDDSGARAAHCQGGGIDVSLPAMVPTKEEIMDMTQHQQPGRQLEAHVSLATFYIRRVF
ncbi:unnamed protein product [Vitrella brassicaformis CCMP3155]|uniref:Uncharacterized protein n=1 Tax=Vitrella brassicaformis (strain CCMP3155) TaxID=1169540 RepID=A0A0G4ER69_VITBC|nr:unnamed protein product [Vitrella brassicaformis CCMP3155]|eukprot:CEL99947.1 unnamed protein product [Vitrella brassicaformis CCMP3155]